MKTGDVMPGVEVTLTTGGFLDTATTDANGHYAFTNLNPGSYSVSLDALDAGYWADPPSYSGKLKNGESLEWDFLIHEQTEVAVTLNLETDGHGLIESSEIVVSPDPLLIKPGEKVVWLTPEYTIDGMPMGFTSQPFSIQFEPLSPLLYRRYQAGAGETIETQVRSHILPGKYRYFIAILLDGKIYTEDPELIDENGDEEGGTGGGRP